MLGTYSLSSGYYDAYYPKAQKVRTLIKQEFEQVFSRYDVMVGPTTPTPAFPIGRKINDPLTMYMNDILHDSGQFGRHTRDQRTVRIGGRTARRLADHR